MRVAAIAKAVLDPVVRPIYEPRRHLRSDDLAGLDNAIESLDLTAPAVERGTASGISQAWQPSRSAVTAVADLAPLAGLTGLGTLSLTGTAVCGPRPAGRAHRAARARVRRWRTSPRWPGSPGWSISLSGTR